MQKFLVVGLGNPGSQYSKNRHNIGFMVLDELANHLGITFYESKNLKSCIAIGQEVVLCKPLTYMNASGEAVQLVQSYYKLADFFVVHDELEIPLGALRFKKGGGHGGHNGLRSIDEYCGKEYVRARCGIGRPLEKSQVAHYVLSDFQEIPKELIGFCSEAIQSFVQDRNLQRLQNAFTLQGKKQEGEILAGSTQEKN